MNQIDKEKKERKKRISCELIIYKEKNDVSQPQSIIDNSKLSLSMANCLHCRSI